MTVSADHATPELIEALQAIVDRKDTTAMVKAQRRNELGQIEDYYVPAYLMRRP